jgi:hypothetical protein
LYRESEKHPLTWLDGLAKNGMEEIPKIDIEGIYGKGLTHQRE